MQAKKESAAAANRSAKVTADLQIIRQRMESLKRLLDIARDRYNASLFPMTGSHLRPAGSGNVPQYDASTWLPARFRPLEDMWLGVDMTDGDGPEAPPSLVTGLRSITLFLQGITLDTGAVHTDANKQDSVQLMTVHASKVWRGLQVTRSNSPLA